MLPQKQGFFIQLVSLDKPYVRGLLQMGNMLLELNKDKCMSSIQMELKGGKGHLAMNSIEWSLVKMLNIY